MTREQEIKEQAEKKALEPSRLMHPYAKQHKVMSAYEIGFIEGAVWADKNPHWIRVGDELPPRWETNPNVSVPVITFGTLGESNIPFVELQRYHFGDGRWQYGDATHWMPFQYPKKGGEDE